MVHSVDVTVTGVHADGPQSEAKLLPGAVDDDWLSGADHTEGGLPAGGGVSRGWVRRQRIWGHGTRQWGHPKNIYNKEKQYFPFR